MKMRSSTTVKRVSEVRDINGEDSGRKQSVNDIYQRFSTINKNIDLSAKKSKTSNSKELKEVVVENVEGDSKEDLMKGAI